MNVRNVVKVMNFHSLLRVDKARRTAVKYQYMEDHLLAMIDSIMNNRNFILDKKALKPRADAGELVLYLGSDFGFCSSFNSQVNERISANRSSQKILIGRKLHSSQDVLQHIGNVDFQKDMEQIQKVVVDAVEQLSYSRITLVYNHYVNASTIVLKEKQIFPVVFDESVHHNEDFMVEGDLNQMLKNLTMTYVSYEIMLAQVFASAAENLMRQNATTESLKRIDEIEEEKHLLALREKRADEFEKVIESFIRMRGSVKNS